MASSIPVMVLTLLAAALAGRACASTWGSALCALYSIYSDIKVFQAQNAEKMAAAAGPTTENYLIPCHITTYMRKKNFSQRRCGGTSPELNYTGIPAVSWTSMVHGAKDMKDKRLPPLSRLLAAMRAERNWTVKTLAEKSGVSPSYISALELGKEHNPTMDLLRKLAAGLSLKPADEHILYFASQHTDDDFIPMADSKIEDGLNFENSGLVREVWLAVPDPLEIQPEPYGKDIAGIIERYDTKYVYFLNDPKKSILLQSSIGRFLQQGTLETHVECVISKDPYLFNPPFVLLHTTDTHNVLGLWVKRIEQGLFYRLYRMAADEAYTLHVNLSATLVRVRKEKAVTLSEYGEYVYDFPRRS